MASFNKVLLMGNLTRKPELRYTPSGTAVCEFTIAVNRRFTQGNETKEDVCFVDITVWDRQADNCNRYLDKGSSVFIEGRLQLDTWIDKVDQKKRSRLRVVAEAVQFLSPRREGGAPGEYPPDGAPQGAPYQGQSYARRDSYNQAAPRQQYGRPAPQQYAPQYPEGQQPGGGIPPQEAPSYDAPQTYGRSVQPSPAAAPVSPADDSGLTDVQGIEDDIPF